MNTDPIRILVADDDGDIRDLVTFKLQQSGYLVESVSDGSQAWGSISQTPPRLAVLDVMMPGLSGLDVLRKLREDARTKDVPVILLTARRRDCDVDVGYASGADEYISKPFSPRELLHRVAAVVGRT